jgi:hypothetical protein
MSAPASEFRTHRTYVGRSLGKKQKRAAPGTLLVPGGCEFQKKVCSTAALQLFPYFDGRIRSVAVEQLTICSRASSL